MTFEEDLYGVADRALTRVDSLKTLLLGSSSTGANTQGSILSQEIRAACVIYSMAELESLTTSLLHIVNGEFNMRTHAIKECKPGLRALMGHTTFNSLRDTRDSHKIWEHRWSLTSYECSPQIAVLPISTRSQPPLDGKTLTPRHFARLWSAYELEGQWFPEVSCAMTLTKLSGVRNDLAHGNVPFGENFSQPGMTVSDIESYMKDMSELFIHLAHAFCVHLTANNYLI